MLDFCVSRKASIVADKQAKILDSTIPEVENCANVCDVNVCASFDSVDVEGMIAGGYEGKGTLAPRK